MDAKVLEQLRQVEKDVWTRNRDRRQVEEQETYMEQQETEWAQGAADLKRWRDEQSSWTSYFLSAMYTLYTWFFYCRRKVIASLFHDETQERKTLVIEIPAPTHPWLGVYCVSGDTEYDVTELVESRLKSGETLTRAWLEANTEMPDDIDPATVTWQYLDSKTFDVREIPSEGLVNEVSTKSKSD